MEEYEIVETLNEAVHDALLAGTHELSEQQLLNRADALLASLPTLSGSTPTAALLLRRYHASLQRELCRGSQPVATPHVIEDEVRLITRAIMVGIEAQEGISIETSVLLALALRARGLDTFCAIPTGGIGDRG